MKFSWRRWPQLPTLHKIQRSYIGPFGFQNCLGRDVITCLYCIFMLVCLLTRAVHNLSYKYFTRVHIAQLTVLWLKVDSATFLEGLCLFYWVLIRKWFIISVFLVPFLFHPSGPCDILSWPSVAGTQISYLPSVSMFSHWRRRWCIYCRSFCVPWVCCVQSKQHCTWPLSWILPL